MKGISAVIATVLMLVIIIALATLVYTFLPDRLPAKRRDNVLVIGIVMMVTIIIVMYALASTMFVEKFERETKYQYTGNLFMMPFRYGVLDQAEQEDCRKDEL